MEVRIIYRSEIYIEGESIRDIREKYNSLNLDPISKNDGCVTDYSFIETVSVENSQTYEDLQHDFDHAFENE